MDPNTFPTKGNLILAKNSLAADCEHGDRYHQRTDRVLYRSGGGIYPDQDKEYHGRGNSAGRG